MNAELFQPLCRPLPQNGNYNYTHLDELSGLIADFGRSAFLLKKRILVKAETASLDKLDEALKASGLSFINLEQAARIEGPEKGMLIGDTDHFTALDAALQQTAIWRKMKEPIFGELTFWQVLQLRNEILSTIEPYPFVLSTGIFQCSTEELYELKRALERYKKYCKYYDEDNLRMLELQKYNQAAVQQHSTEAWKGRLLQWLEKLEEVKAAATAGLYEIKQTLLEKRKAGFLARLSKERSALLSLRIFVEQYGDEVVTEPGFFNVSGVLRQRNKAWKSLDLDIGAENNPDTAYQLLSQRIKAIQDEYTAGMDDVEDQIKSINQINSDHPQITRALAMLDEVLNQINASKLFITKKECNAQSIVKILSSVDKLHADLHTVCQFKDIHSLIDWYACRQSMHEGAVKLFQQMRNLPRDEWGQQLEFTYFSAVLARAAGLFERKTEVINWMPSLERMETIARQGHLRTLHRLYEQSLQHPPAGFDSKALKRNTLSWSDWMLSLPDEETPYGLYLSSFEKESVHSKYDLIVCIDPTEDIEDALCFMESKNGICDFQVFTMPQSVLSEVPVSHQLAEARKLSESYKPYLAGSRFFQMRGRNLISAAPRVWQEEVSNALADLMAKEYRIDTQDGFTNFILSTERKTFLLVFDENIAYCDETLYNSQKTLACLEAAGVRIIRIDTFSFYEQGETLEAVINHAFESENAVVNPTPLYEGIEH